MNMKKKLQFLTILVITLVSSSVFAQSGSVSGIILDADTGEPLPGATVLLIGTNKGVASNSNGEYEIRLTSTELR